MLDELNHGAKVPALSSIHQGRAAVGLRLVYGPGLVRARVRVWGYHGRVRVRVRVRQG